MLLLIFYLFLALGVSFLCSMLESGILSLSRSQVAALVSAGRPSGKLLAGMKNNIERPLAAILTLNTVAHTVGAAGVGAQAVNVFGQMWVGATSAVLTVLILVFSEIIPKTLGVVYASQLAVFTAYVLHGMIFLTYPLVALFQALSRALARQGEPRLSREEYVLITELSHHEGALHEDEYRIIHNLLRLRSVHADDVMTPRTVVFMLPQDLTAQAAIDEHGPLQFARIPVYEADADHPVGVVLRHDIFEVVRDGQPERRLSELSRPLHAVPQQASLDRVLAEFMWRSEQFFLVVDEYGGTAGIITLEDAIETLLGQEIVDETDVVTDLRELAGRLFESKLRGQPWG